MCSGEVSRVRGEEPELFGTAAASHGQTGCGHPHPHQFSHHIQELHQTQLAHRKYKNTYLRVPHLLTRVGVVPVCVLFVMRAGGDVPVARKKVKYGLV